MDQTNSLRTGRTHWLLTGALLLLTLIGAVAMVIKLPRTYQSESSVVLLASRTASEPNGNNPYLSFSPSLTLTADIVSRELMAPTTAQNLAANGFPDSYAVTLATYAANTTGSVLLVAVTGTDKASVERTLYGVTNEISASLTKLQAADPAKNRIRAVTLSMTRRATISVSDTARPMAVVVGLGLALSVGIPWIVDIQIAKRVIRRKAEPAAAPPQEAGLLTDERWAIAEHVARSDSPTLAHAGSYEHHPAPGAQPPH